MKKEKVNVPDWENTQNVFAGILCLLIRIIILEKNLILLVKNALVRDFPLFPLGPKSAECTGCLEERISMF